MHRSVKRLALAAVAAALVCVGPASSVASAVAWNPAGQARAQGVIEFRLNGGSPVNCSIVAEGLANAEGYFNPAPATWPPNAATCSNGQTIRFSLRGFGQKNGPGYAYSIFAGAGLTASPWGGTFVQDWATWIPFTNGSGITPSQLTFSNTKVGRVNLGCCQSQVTATGVIKFTTGAGGLITLV